MSQEIDIGQLNLGIKVTAGNALQVLGDICRVAKEIGVAGTALKGGLAVVAAAMQNTEQHGNKANNVLNKTAVQMSAATQKSKEFNQTLSQTGEQSTGIDKYSVKINKLNSQLSIQEKIVEKLSNELHDLEKTFADIGVEGNSFNIEEAFPEKVRQFDIELAKEEELRNSIFLTEKTQEQATQKAIAAAEKKAEAVAKAAEKEKAAQEKAVMRQDDANSRLALSTMAMALNTISSSADGALGKIGQLSSQVIFLKQSLNSVASAGAKLGTGIAGGIGIAISAISMIASEIQRVEQERIQAAQKAAQDYATSSVEISAINKNIKVLEDQNSSIEQITKAKQELINLMPNMVTGYNATEGAILKTVDALKEEAKWLENDANKRRDAAAALAQVNADEYLETMKKIKAADALLADEVTSTPMSKMLGGTSERDLALGAVFGAGADNAFKTTEDILAKRSELEKELLEDLDNSINGIRAKIEQLSTEGMDLSFLTDSFIRDSLLESGDSFDVDTYAQSIVDKYKEIVDAIPPALQGQLADAPDAIKNVFNEKIQSALNSIGDSEFDLSTAMNAIENQMKSLLDEDFMENLDILNNLGEKITNGDATSAELQSYDTMLGQIKKSAESAGVEINDLAAASGSSSKELLNSVAKAKAAKSSYSDLAKGTNDLFNSYRDLNSEMKDINTLKAVAKALEEGEKSSQYGDALAYVADMYNVTEDEAAGMLDAVNAEIESKEILAATNVLLTNSEITLQIATLEYSISAQGAMANADQATKDAVENMIANLTTLQNKMSETFAADGTPKVPADISSIKISSGGGSKSRGGGSGGSSKNSVLDDELARLEHKKKLDQVTYSEEIAWLERIRKKYAKTTEEKRNLDEKIYSAKKELMQAELEHRRNMDDLTLKEEVESLETQLRLYKKDTQAYIEIEEQLYQAKKDLQQQVYDLNVYYGKLNLKEQAQEIEKQIAQYKKGTQARIDLEKELYDIQQQLRDEDISSIDKTAGAVVQALQNRYEEMRKSEIDSLNESKENWKEWADTQVQAIQEQIDALDELTKEQDNAEKEAEKRRKVASLEQMLEYTSDEYNQKKLKQQIDDAQKDLDDFLTKIDRDAQKEALKKQQDLIKEQADFEQETIEKQIESVEEKYDELLKNFNLQAEAEKMLMTGTQEDIINLIKAFAPEYDLAGQTLGEKLVNGFISKVGDVEAWFANVSAQVSEYQEMMAQVATQAADSFMSNYGISHSAQNQKASEIKQTVINVQIGKEISTASEIRTELERMLVNLSDM